MSGTEDAAARFLAIVSAPTVDTEELAEASDRLFEQTREATQEELDRALGSLAGALGRLGIGRAAYVAYACAGIVEGGGDPLLVAAPIIPLMSTALASATPFVETCLNEAGLKDRAATASEVDQEELEAALEKFGQQVGEHMPDNAEAWWAVRLLSASSLALFCRSKEARKSGRAHEPLLTQVRTYPVRSDTIEGMEELLKILDDEALIVLYPGLKRGYRVRISGIVSNFQLHTLLEDAVIGDPADGWLPGNRPSPEAVAVAREKPSDDPPSVEGVFNLVNWHGLLPDGSLPEDYHHGESDHWIWNEGVPADIDPFEGTRVVLLGYVPFGRSWSNGRGSPFPRAELEVLAQMPAAEAQDWLTRIATAASQRAPSATGGE